MTSGFPRRLGLALLVALAAALPVQATTYRFLELEELWARSELAVFGTVAAVEVEERGGEPWTLVRLDVERNLLADEPASEEGEADELTLSFLGGTLESGRSLEVELMPRFREGEQVLVLAYDDEALASPVVGFRQGLWRLTGAGLVDEDGRRLSLEDQALLRDGEGGALDELLDAVERALREAR